MKQKIYLVCNAHLDPVWLWQRTEGMAEALSTFRIAADFCERYDNFVFNHNESVLYEWVMENDKKLFERIQNLVKKGKWRIMGGWYLQPDVIMPCGESIIRQIRTGNEFFKKYFGDIPKTAINFDSFGHTRGLVQILKKCGYENYAYLRPRDTECGPFVWEGFDGSRVNALKLYEWYNTPKGEAIDRIKSYINDFPEREINLVTWGIGNHGGGPSEKDLNDINKFAEEFDGAKFIPSDFDTYFNALKKDDLNVNNKSLTHCMVGCYTSMARVKQGHRNLENKIGMCEKMLWQSGAEYDKEEFERCEKALLFTEFHDVLPGSAIKKVEDDSLRLIDYGAEIADRLTAKAFFKLCSGQPKAKDGEIPVLVYNPHPYEVEGDFEVEFQMAEQNHPDNGIYDVKVRAEDGGYIPCQLEQEDSAHGMDWRKKVSFHTVLSPMAISRFDCELNIDKNYRRIKPFFETDSQIILENDFLKLRISKTTGLIDKYTADGKSLIKSIKIAAFKDNADPWGMETDGFNELLGEFELDGRVRVIENGDVRTKVQAMFKYEKSYCVVTYMFPKIGKHIDIELKMLSNDENTMFKLCIDTALDKNAKALAQTMFGTEETRKEGLESVFQKWCGLNDLKNSVTVINNGTYGGSFENGMIKISLLRTAVYSAHPVENVGLASEDRLYDHIDMGERSFKFRIFTNEKYSDYEAEIFNQPPYVLAMFPSGDGEKTYPTVKLDNKNIVLSALKDYDGGTLLRLYNSANSKQVCSLKAGEENRGISFNPFEVKTFVKTEDELKETDMLGRRCD